MSELSLRTFHPVENREVASLSARLLTSFVIAIAGLLSFVPFIAYFAEH
jgi:hypothetical protein